MNDSDIRDIPSVYDQLLKKCEEIGFNMPSDLYIGPLLKTLVASKPGGRFLELGTGMSLSLVWMIEGMDQYSKITSVDFDQQLTDIAKEFFGDDGRVNIACSDGTEWVNDHLDEKFDMVFADTWSGKYTELEEVLNMVKFGGFYVIDDLTRQPNWPEWHDKKAEALLEYLEGRSDLNLVKMNWSTGVLVATKIAQ